ncbi:MAG: 3-deoxy-D-manno-octulosonic acid kinase [Gammaproteobacteria bacterium]|nr:3-deoxy-D-manno-octulosonic acid kinase [Gammaproteobacteria bacterium]MDH5777957.1 3-deoxy-D-manno-octulosonic acid kinase [Gammaproteobacteria bacterium]
MKPSIKQNSKYHIIYDADVASMVTPDWFSSDFWQNRNAISGQATGRGTTWFINQGRKEWVLRHYRRGGLVASLLEDRYLWTGLEKTRPWQEWNLLSHMFQLSLPVPQPIAAMVERDRLIYRADILSFKIPNTQSLAQRLTQGFLDLSAWRRIGQTIGRFHQAGIYHADLNAHNILLDSKDRVYLIDFDRGEVRPRGTWEKKNLDRLIRSLLKLDKFYNGKFYFKESDWRVLSKNCAKLS